MVPAADMLPSSGGSCSPSQVQTCMQNAPICDLGETAVKTSYCCVSCRRQPSMCNPDQFVSCSAGLRACGADERPVALTDECCRSCLLPSVLPPPSCKTCADTERCAFTRTNDTFVYSCRPKQALSLVIRVTDPTRIATFNTFSRSQVRGLLSEILGRWCENNQNDLCNVLSASSTLDGDLVSMARTSDGTFTVTLETSSSPNNWVAALQAATADPYSVGDMSVAVQNPSASSASMLSPLFFVMFVLCLAALLM
eukprot:TRINITY_DN547_c0_g1_i2.p1 TRINITY_DN547_c0_g1~~TRINITY_DN547_c0_g1_i2.p1  ORF type:complete len:254 (+),score=75.16 TRINITY_DN547_c0_g1_i2:111-872(+)